MKPRNEGAGKVQGRAEGSEQTGTGRGSYLSLFRTERNDDQKAGTATGPDLRFAVLDVLLEKRDVHLTLCLWILCIEMHSHHVACQMLHICQGVRKEGETVRVRDMCVCVCVCAFAVALRFPVFSCLCFAFVFGLLSSCDTPHHARGCARP